MAATNIAQLWTPQIWLEAMNERMNAYPSFFNSGAVVRRPEFDAFAEGGGITINLPYFHDITGQADEPQIEGTEPSQDNITAGLQIAPIFNRAKRNDVTALAGGVSGTDPVQVIINQMTMRRLKQRMATMISISRGIFGFSNAPGGGGAMQAARNDIFSETGANPSANNIISAFSIVDTIALLGELADTTLGGGIAMHPIIRASLIKQDQISFQHYSMQAGAVLSQGAAPGTGEGFVETYKGYRVAVSNSLVRAGAVSGFVFDTYIFASGVFAWGEKPQVSGPPNQGPLDVASLTLWIDAQINTAKIYDRTRFLLHPNGMRWTGAPAGQSASNTELATAANWTLDYASADRVGIVCVRSNG